LSFSEFISSFLRELNNRNISYVIERNYELLPEYTSNDVDFLIAESDRQKFIEVAINVINYLKMKILLITTAHGGGRIYLFDPKTQAVSIIRIDFMTHIHFKGIPLLNAYTILKNRIKRDTFYIPSSGMEAAMSLIIPLIYSGKVKEKYKESIHTGCLKDKENFVKAFEPFLPTKKIQSILDFIAKKEFPVLERQRKKILLSYILHNKYQSFTGIIKSIASYFQRLLNPSGLVISIMGSDGSGKSSVISMLSTLVKTLYPEGKFIKFHWRPGVLPQLRTLFGKSKLESEFVISNPHSPRKRSRIISFFRWLYYTLDYFIGYYLKIFPMKIKTTAVVMDRYYLDIIVDPIRYGFNLHQWLLKLPLKLIPKPDLTIYLDNEPEELYKRKQELPVEELRRQVNAWRKFIPSFPNARIVTTDKPLEDVVNEVTGLVLERRAEMTRKILKVDPDESRYLWKSDITGYIALPSKKNCHWIIPINPKLARKAWDLYQPYSLFGRIYKSATRSLSGYGSLRLLKHKKLSLEFSDSEHASLFMKCITDVFGKEDIALAISTGTPSSFRKITSMIMDSRGNVLGFTKIGETPLAIQRIKRETKILKLIAHSSLLIAQKSSANSQLLSAISIRVPELLYEGEIGNGYMLIQSPAPFEGKSGSRYFNDDYANVLRILIDNTSVKKKFIESEFYKNLKSGIDNYMISYRELLKQGLDYLEKNIGDKEIIFTLSHGDFAPWNMLWSKDRKEVFVYDWESASVESPASIDLVHFLFQTGFLLKKLKDEKLLDFCIDEKPYSILKENIQTPLLETKALLLIYLLKMAVDEDAPQILSRSAAERRKLLKLILGDRL